MRPVLARLLGFLKANPGAVLVLGFQVLLVACAGLLVFGLSFLAENVAVAAYFMLAAGVIVQLACFVRDHDGE